MSANMMKIVGIITMILAHPIGYRLWNAILWTPFIYGGNTSGYTEVELAIYVGVGILEIFFVGLGLFLMGVILGHRKEKQCITKMANVAAIHPNCILYDRNKKCEYQEKRKSIKSSNEGNNA